MTHKEMRQNADKLAELCRLVEGYSHEIPDTEAGQWACAVTEAGCHPAGVLRAARLLSRTYL